jgi:hypothetical protein
MLMQRVAAGKKAPAPENRPNLLPGLDFYLNAYLDLRHDRAVGLAYGPIPWSSIVRWAELHGIATPDEIADLQFIIRQVEDAINAYEAKKGADK